MKTCECQSPDIFDGICCICHMPYEHEEDFISRLESEIYGKNHAAEFANEFTKELVELISTYSDGEADRKLQDLREQFWAGIWKPKV